MARMHDLEHDLEDAEQLQRALDRIAAGSPAAAGRGGGDLDALVALAARLASALPAEAPPRFRARLQADLQAELAARRPRPRHGWRRLMPRLVGAAMAVVLVLSTSVAVSADSVPGDALYPVKRAAEDLRWVLSVTPARRARVEIDIARARLDEVQALVSRGVAVDAGVIDAVITAHAELLAAAHTAGDAEVLAEAIDTVDASHQALTRLAQDAPAAVSSGLTAAARQLRALTEPSPPRRAPSTDGRAPSAPTAPLPSAGTVAPTPTVADAGAAPRAARRPVSRPRRRWPRRWSSPPRQPRPRRRPRAPRRRQRPRPAAVSLRRRQRRRPRPRPARRRRPPTRRSPRRSIPRPTHGRLTWPARRPSPCPPSAPPPGRCSRPPRPSAGGADGPGHAIVRRLAAVVAAAGLAWAPLGTAGRSVGAPTRPPRDGLAQNGPPAARLSLPLLAHGTLERYIVAGATAQARTATALARTPRTPAATATRTATPPGSATPVASSSPTPGATLTPVASPTPTAPSPSPAGPSPTPSATATPSITPTASTTPTPSRTPTPRADPAGERLVPWASLREGARTVTFDAAARTYRLAYRGGMTLTFEIDLRHPDNARGRLAVREVTSGRFPMSGAGLYYRQADGTEIEPRLFSLVGAVDEVAHALLPEGDGVELSVRETLENVAHQKRYTVRLVGRALEIRAESLDGGVPPGAGGYAGFTAGDIEGSMDGVSVRLPYMDAVPVTMLDHQWFASTLLDYPRSHADALAARGPTLLPGAFANEIGAFYRPDAAGEVRPVDETVWVTLSPDVTDVFAVPRQPPSPHRPALAGRVHVTLAGGPGAPAFATQAAWLARLQGWGVDDLQVHRDGWIDPRVPAPAQWPPAPAAGGPEGLRSLANTAGGRLSVTLAYTMTDAGCADRPSPLYRAADRVMGRDGMPKQVTAGTCPDGMATGGYLLAPDAAVRLAAAAGDELARAGIGGSTCPRWPRGTPPTPGRERRTTRSIGARHRPIRRRSAAASTRTSA